jgi:uncharacterized linocin/CFP29 family protein
MLSIQELISNGVVTTQQFQTVDDKVRWAARQNNTLIRGLMNPVGPVGLGKQRYDHDILTEVSTAVWGVSFPQGGEDAVQQTRSTVDIPVINKTFRLDYRNLLSSRTTGTPLDVSAAGSASQRVTELLGEVITQGYSRDGTNYDISGLYQSAGNTYGTTADFATAGKALSATSAGMALLMADNINPPYNLSLHPTQFSELAGSVHTGGIDEFDRVKKLIGGDILVNPHLTAATGMMTATPEQEHFALVVGQDISSELWQKSPDPKSDVMGRAYMAATPVIYDANAICTLTSI